MDYEKLKTLYADKRVQPRSKLVFCLLENGFLLEEIINFPAENISMLKKIKNGERFFMAYAKGAGIVERIAQSGFLFPSTNDKPMQRDSILRTLQRACRANGFQLHELDIDGLVQIPTRGRAGGFAIQNTNATFDDVLSFIKNQNK